MSSPALSIIIPTHKRHLKIRQLLSTIEKQSERSGVEVLVVSNFADSKLSEELQFFENTLKPKLFIANKPGVNASRNLGLNQSTGEIVLFIDDDCELHKRDFLRRVLKAHRECPDHQVIGGGYESSYQARLDQKAYNFISSAWCEAYQFKSDQTWALLGGNISYKSVIRESNWRFNEDITYGGSETEFHVRLFGRGFQMKYWPQLSVQHTPKVTPKKIFHKALKQARTASQFQFPELPRATDLCKYLYTQKCAKAARTESQFNKYLEMYRLHEDAFLNTAQYSNALTRELRMFEFHRKYLLC